MPHRTTFTSREAKEIRELLAAKLKAGRDEQKQIRGRIRRLYGFYISDFSDSGAFGPLDFDDLVRTRQITIADSPESVAVSEESLSFASASTAATAHRPFPKQHTPMSQLRKSRADSDEAYVIDLCDEILGRAALRQNRFPFLRGDGGHSLPVDAWYPGLNLVVEYRERQHTEAVKFFDRRQTVSGVSRGEQRRLYDQRRREILPARGIQLIEVSCTDLAHHSGKRLRRDRTRDRQVLRETLASLLPKAISE
jgi:hypothetical protein